MPPTSTYNKKIADAFITAYRENNGFFTKTCKDLGLKHQVVQEWYTSNNEFMQKIKEARQFIAEKVEKGLIASATNEENPNTIAQIFYLKKRYTDPFTGDMSYSDNTFALPANTGVLWFSKPEETEQKSIETRASVAHDTLSDTTTGQETKEKPSK